MSDIDNTSLSIRLKSYDEGLLGSSAKAIVEVAKDMSARVIGPIPLPSRKYNFAVLRSPHIDKKSREKFAIVMHRRLLKIKEIDSQMVARLAEINLPNGVHAEISQ